MLETKTNFGGTAYHWVSEMCADVHDWWAGSGCCWAGVHAVVGLTMIEGLSHHGFEISAKYDGCK